MSSVEVKKIIPEENKVSPEKNLELEEKNQDPKQNQQKSEPNIHQTNIDQSHQIEKEEEKLEGILKEVNEKLLEEKWTRNRLENYHQRDFKNLDLYIQESKNKKLVKKLRNLCVTHLDKSPKSIIALYIAGILTYEEEILDDSYIFEIITLFKETKKWTIVEYLVNKVLKYGENRFLLKVLEDCYQETENQEGLVIVWTKLCKIDYENGNLPKKLGDYYLETENQDQSIHYYKIALRRFARKKSYKSATELWHHLLPYIWEDLEFFLSIEEELSKIDGEKSSELLKELYEYYKDNENYIESKIKILHRILHWIPKNKGIRENLIEAYYEKYKEHTQLEEYIKKSNLKELNFDINKSIDIFEKYIKFDRGNYVYHRSWGVGKIVKCEENYLIIDFEIKKKHKMSLNLALTSLKKLIEDHIWIKKNKEYEFFNKEDKESIEKSLLLIFKSYNNKVSMQEIKKEILEIIPPENWNRWWNKAKNIMRKNSMFGSINGKRDLYFLRNKPLTFEEETYIRFTSSNDINDKIEAILDYLKNTENRNSDYFDQMLNFFVDLANKKDKIEERRIKSYLLLRKIRKNYKEVIFELKFDSNDLLENKENLIEIYEKLTDNDFKKDILDIIKRNSNHWSDIYLRILKETTASKIHNYIFEELMRESSELERGIKNIIENHRSNNENYFWLIKTMTKEDELFEKFGIDKNRSIFNLFHILDIINKSLNNKKINNKKSGSKSKKKLFTQILDFLIKENVFKNYIQTISKVDARKILAMINGMKLLDEKSKIELTSILFNHLPELKKEEIEVENQGIHEFLVTQESYDRKQKELEHILNVEIPNNSKAIGIAQELGDLRENADYISALEHQKQLQKMASNLTNEISKIKILRANEVDETMTNPGTFIELLNLNTKKRENYTILGEWESDIEKRFISYKSPFGKALLGHKIEDKIIFNHGGIQKKYLIKSIKKAKEILN